MPLINCRVELKLKLTKYCVLFVAGNEDNLNDDANADNIIFTIKDTKLYVPTVTLSAKDNQKLLKFLSKGFERSVYWNKYKTKIDNKNMTNKFRYFLKSNFVGIKSWQQSYYLLKGIINNYNVIINGKCLYDQVIDSGIKRYEKITKFITGQGEDYAVGCLLDYEYLKVIIY